MQGIAYTILVLSLTGCFVQPEEISTWAPDPFCPYPSDEILFYTDPDDCSKYIECYEGDKYIRDCAAGLLWDEDKLACDFPRNVDCKSRPTPTTPDTPVTDITGTTNDFTPDLTTEAPSEVPTEVTTAAPIETTSGVPPNTTPEAPATETSGTTGATEDSTTPVVPTTGEPVSTTFSPAHICDNELDGTYLADPTDCKKFYECRSGVAIAGICPTGTEWNEDILNCDRPENVKC